MHGHKEVDVISVMVEGRIAHEGSLEHGQELAGQSITVKGGCLAYLTKGKGVANGQAVSDGDLIRGDELLFKASEDTQLITVYLHS